MKKIIIGIIAGIVVLTAGWFILNNQPEGVFGKESYQFQRFDSDVIGTHTGTTTTGVAFRITATGGQTATTTYISRIGGNKNVAAYHITPTAASSSANAIFSLMGSNDDYCETTATSTTDKACVGDCVLDSEIHWHNLVNHLKDTDHSTSFDNASSTLIRNWQNPKVGAGNEIVLKDLDEECLRMDVTGSSTVIYSGLRTK